MEHRLAALLAGLSSYERTRSAPVAWSLEPTRKLLAAGLSPRRPAVQVGGSKGKGTTVLYLESIARAAGLRTGAYLSPHLSSATERVLLDGVPVVAGLLADTVERILDDAGRLSVVPSYFEVLTVAAARLFAAAAVDLSIYEVGLGGRLDATTAVPVDAVVLTHVELEHTALLGDTVAAIAAEKAHIMRPRKPAFLASTASPEVLAVFTAHATEVGAHLHLPPRVEDLRATTDGWEGTLACGGRAEPFALHGASAIELPAFAIAVACLHGLFPGRRLPLQPVPRPHLPGRFEVIPDGDSSWVLDGAHTPESTAQVAAELRRRLPGRPVSALFASASDKQWQAGLSRLLDVVDRWYVTALDGTAAADPERIASWLAERGRPAAVVATPAAGIRLLRAVAGVRLVLGSFYLVGAVRHHLPTACV